MVFNNQDSGIMHNNAKELIDLYKQGLFVEGELIRKLIELSLHVRPQDYLDDLPNNLRQKIKETVKEPPELVKEVFLIKYPAFNGEEVGVDEVIAKIDQNVYESMWRVHDYLYK